MTFAPCTRCRRHVHASAQVCPFCGAPTAPAASPSTLVGRWSRAAVFAGASLAGCWTSKGPQAPATPVNADAVATTTASDTTGDDTKTGTATIRGVIKVTDGSLLPPTEVRVSGHGVSRRLRVTSSGRFEVTSLPAGAYTLTIVQEPQDGNPRDRPGTIARSVTLADGRIETVEIAVEPYISPRDNACCMPYGAPPQRRRVV